MRFYIFIIQLAFAFNEAEQITLTNPIQEYRLIDCEEISQCIKCNFEQMNFIKQCQVNKAIIKMNCYYQWGDDEQAKYPQIDYKICHLDQLSSEYLFLFILLSITINSLYYFYKEKEEIDRKYLYRILNN